MNPSRRTLASPLGQYFNKVWYRRNHPLSLLLAPVGWLYCCAAMVRRYAYKVGLGTVNRFEVPVIVVGNISVGGTGKTPLVAWLGRFLTSQGVRPAIICRGYGGTAKTWPQQVRVDSDPVVVGEESVLLARRSGCPVTAGPDRAAAVRALLEHTDCNLIISDDGLQHFRLARDLEIAVVDGVRRHGNGRCLPAGPLRERISTLSQFDILVTTEGAKRGEFELRLVPSALRRVLEDREQRSLNDFKGSSVHAVCGIGHPARFFRLVESHGIMVIRHEFADHHPFEPDEIRFDDGLPVLMTEKDAIKCRRFAGPEHWYVPVDAQPHRLFGDRVLTLLKGLPDGQETA